MARVGKKDGNHDELVAAFVELGCSVVECHRTGIPGWPDLALGAVGVTHLVECKNPETAYGRRGLNQNQMTFTQTWRGEPVSVVTCRDDVLALVTKWRKACR